MKDKYTIGLDIGINNVGWAIFSSNTNRIENYGVRFFNPASAAADRRIFRSSRRRKKRKDTRIEDVLKICRTIDFPSHQTIDASLIEKRFLGITKKIEKQDITNILCYFVSHRGYIPYGDEEIQLVELNGKLPCQYYYEKYKNQGYYRATNKVVANIDNLKEIKTLLKCQQKYYEEIDNNFVEKIITIFVRKRSFWQGPGSTKSLTPYGRFKSEKDVENYLAKKMRNDNYEKFIFDDLIGKCEIEVTEKCAPKLNFYAEKFNFLNDFINISFKNIEGLKNGDCFYETQNNDYKLNEKGLDLVFIYCIEHLNLKYSNIFKDLFNTNIDNIEHYRTNKEKKANFSTMNGYRYVLNELLKRDLSTEWIENIISYNEIIRLFTLAPGIVELYNMIKGNDIINYEFNNEELVLIKDLYNKFKKDSLLSYHALSEKVLIRAINDMLSLQLNFMQVRRKFDYDKKARNEFIKIYNMNSSKKRHIDNRFVDDIIASPQVKKSLRQSINVINAIIDSKNGQLPEIIAIESTKDMNSRDKKIEIEERQRKEEKLRKEAKDYIITQFGDKYVTEANIIKYMLYNETNGHCSYCNNKIDPNNIIMEGYEVEHILPRAESFDNSFINKTISCKECNAKKGKQTPYEFLTKLGRYDEFKKRVLDNKNISNTKKENLLFEGNISKYSTRFFNRNLRDTAYATTELIKQINIFNYYLEFLKEKQFIKTLSTPGQLTYTIRTRSNLPKNRDVDKFHHAVDASIIASIPSTEIGSVLVKAQNDKNFWIVNKGKYTDKNDLLYKVNISNTISQIKEIKDDNTRYSNQVIKQPQGQISNQKIYELIKKGDNYYKIEQISDIYLLDIKKDKKLLDEIFSESTNKKTLLCYDNDKKTFNKLKNIYEKFKNEEGNCFINYCLEKYGISKEQFDDRLYGIYASDKQGSPIIKKLRYYELVNEPYLLEKTNINKKANTYLALHSLSQLCTEVYFDIDKKQFLFLPIYTISMNLKLKTVNKNDKYYKILYDKYIGNRNTEYIVSLYNGDNIEIIKKDGTIITDIYKYFHKTNNCICCNSGQYFTKSDVSLTVFDVTVLGNKKTRLTYKIK